MAGRGRGGMGRGAGMSFNIETLGFGRGEALPGPSLAPPPVFPALELKPVPLLSGEEHDYILALKQEFRGTIRESPYFMKLNDRKKDIVRYSDKYSLSHQDNQANWVPDWLRLPGELQRKVKSRSKVKAIIKPKLQIQLPSKDKDKTIPEVEITKTLEELEKKEEAEEKKEEEEDKAEEELEEEEYYDEEDIDDTDYNQNYFDNGENYGLDEDDDLDEGPVY